ncbi:hypothetical protein ACFS5L_42470 [Streptomyces phyllanthi]|uniref:hypothetical protein n=1 Tax=Streptomyces phyllanthi TaxID=1803180 RepID=UPI002AD311D3|nr:hypothetical protein [Streptomyces phyllanthi]
MVEESRGPALSEAELTKVTLRAGDVEGHKVSKPTATVTQKDVKAGDEACVPVAYAVAGTVLGEPRTTVQRETASEPDARAKASAAPDITRVLVRLSAYEGDEAQAAMDSLSEAADSCTKGFTLTVDGTEQQVTKIAKTTAPQGADQAIALNVTSEKVPMKVVVIRKGSTLGYFTAINIASAASGKNFAFPTEVVDAQLVKLA